ncbi:hypothetical protein [Plantactinospora sp. GCM10030261]|uniref:hypothetical protein n=1 Tax=Plantactinospora sp. GCM10030261 TaxID=3273420 RepID=UPI00361BEF76
MSTSRRLVRLLGVITAFVAVVVAAYGVADGTAVTMGHDWVAPSFNPVIFR